MSSTKSILFLVVSISLLCLITACGGDDAFNGGCNAANTPTSISSVSVVGSFTDTGPTIEVIDDSADFTVSWDLSSSCTYTYQLYLAPNSTSDPIDIQFASGTCGYGYTCSYNNDVTCSFNATNKTISCGGGTVDVSVLLPGSTPTSTTRYFILKASNEMMDSAEMATAQLRFDY